MQKLGEIVHLFTSVQGSSDRVAQTCLTLDSHGVLGDKFYAKDIERSVLLTSTDSYALAKLNGISLEHGVLGENILMDGNPYALPMGTHLQIGSTLLVISQPCTICNHLSVFDQQLPKLLKNDRGVFAKVLHEGTIRLGDPILLLKNS
ncbi:MAG TPA: MOSC domain-containing protein [Campylobacterales bacterium]|nr:MOSC domain-containing protein [Campylobacterales bacterium]